MENLGLKLEMHIHLSFWILSKCSSTNMSVFLIRKPEKLHKWMKLVLDGYHLNKQSTTMDSARQLMNPTIINRLIQLKDIVEDQFM